MIVPYQGLKQSFRQTDTAMLNHCLGLGITQEGRILVLAYTARK
jgi:hypothetical protein